MNKMNKRRNRQAFNLYQNIYKKEWNIIKIIKMKKMKML